MTASLVPTLDQSFLSPWPQPLGAAPVSTGARKRQLVDTLLLSEMSLLFSTYTQREPFHSFLSKSPPFASWQDVDGDSIVGSD